MLANYDPGKETTHPLDVHDVFNDLRKDDLNDHTHYSVYAHHLARACWHTARIVLRQTSPEAEGIFDFILELHTACKGRWNVFYDMGIQQEDLDEWLEFSGLFLSHLGNYFVSLYPSYHFPRREAPGINAARSEPWKPQSDTKGHPRQPHKDGEYISQGNVTTWRNHGRDDGNAA